MIAAAASEAHVDGLSYWQLKLLLLGLRLQGCAESLSAMHDAATCFYSKSAMDAERGLSSDTLTIRAGVKMVEPPDLQHSG